MDKNKKFMFVGVLVAVALAVGGCSSSDNGDAAKGISPSGASGKGGKPAPVLIATAGPEDMRVLQSGLGTVVSLGTVTVRSRVEGQLVSILFKEGQLVKAGDVLAEIDPRPFEAQLAQVQGQAARNQALLKNAKLDLERYKALRDQDSIAVQQVDAQESLLQQYQGTVLADQGLVDHAKLQLAFTRITAPISGRIGLRQIDSGNNVTTSDALAVINQLQPIAVVFTVPEDVAPVVARRLADARKIGRELPVEAWDRGSKSLLAKGVLLTIDNQIDAATGTVKLKAQFTNDEGALFPNQFVNVRLLLDTLHHVTVIPEAAVQHGNGGPFAYVVAEDDTVNIRPLALGVAENGKVTIKDGLAAGERVVINGTDKLRDGAQVVIANQGDGKSGKPGNGAPAGGNKEALFSPAPAHP